MARLHTDKEYEGELRKIREHLLLMGAKVEEMIAASMRALTERDTELASSPTLCRFENRADRATAVAIQKVLVEQFIASLPFAAVAA